jgi:hypothetical protein
VFGGLPSGFTSGETAANNDEIKHEAILPFDVK